MERSLNNSFAPGRNTGFMISNHFLDKKLTYSTGVFRTSDSYGDDNDGDSINEGGYSFSGRITGVPYYEDEGRKLVHLGLSYSYQNAHDGEMRFSAKPEMHMADRFADTGSFTADDASLFNPELAVVYGSFSLQSEYTFTHVNASDERVTKTPFPAVPGFTEVELIDPGSNPDFHAWYFRVVTFLPVNTEGINLKVVHSTV